MLPETQTTTSPFALFELNGNLHLYILESTENTGTIWHYQHDGQSHNWNLVETPTSPAVASGSGIAGRAVNSIGFLSYLSGDTPITNGQANICVTQLSPSGWATPQRFPATMLDYPGKNHPTVPQLASSPFPFRKDLEIP